jgi:lipopolysaccharide export system permease protein
MALPIAVLVSSVMVMGNLSERYELASMKSAGIPLLRIMAPLIVVSIILMVISFIFGNNVIPYSNLKFQSRLYDIRKQKPALNLQTGVFNDDFKGYTIRIGDKAKDNRKIEDVLIYDHTPERRLEQIQVIAEEGEMYTTADRNFLILELTEGKQYQNVKESNAAKRNYPFVRTNFKKWTKVFDMSEFNLSRTDEKLFSNHYQMLTSRQMLQAIDSLHLKKIEVINQLANNTKPYFHFRRLVDTIYKHQPLNTNLKHNQKIKEPYELLDINKRETAKQKGIVLTKRLKEYSYTAGASLTRTNQTITEHWVWFHRKFSFALSCLIFIFIGAPMGAIIRKGGFGWPMLVAIVFFMTFIVLFMTGEKLAKEQVVEPHIGIYLPIYVLLPLGIFLTYKAMNDSKLFNIEAYTGRVKALISIIRNLIIPG